MSDIFSFQRTNGGQQLQYRGRYSSQFQNEDLDNVSLSGEEDNFKSTFNNGTIQNNGIVNEVYNR